MINLLLIAYAPFSREALNTFYAGLRVMFLGMTTVILVLFLFYIIIKFMIRTFPEKEK